MKISISLHFFHIEDQGRSRVASLLSKAVLRFLEECRDELEILVRDDTLQGEVRIAEAGKLLSSAIRSSSRCSLSYRVNPESRGPIRSHNENFADSSGDIFLVVGDEVELEDDGWISKLVRPFERPEVAISVFGGGRASDLKGDYDPGFAEGDSSGRSVLAIRSALARQYGLFATDLTWGFFEVPDLCLRYRQMGFEVAQVELEWRSGRNSHPEHPGPLARRNLRERNRARMVERWSRPIGKGKFSNRLLFDLQGGGWGDAVASFPALLRLLHDHPSAEVDVFLTYPFLAPIFEIPRVRARVEQRPVDLRDRAEYESYDRVFHLGSVEFSIPLYLGALIAMAAGVDFDSESAIRSLRGRFGTRWPGSIAAIPKGSMLALVHAESLRADWEGRAADLEVMHLLVGILRKRGFVLGLLGGPDPEPEYRGLIGPGDLDLCGHPSLAELIGVFCHSSLFLGIDSGPLHLAQLSGVPTFAIFGATLPSSKLLDSDRNFGYARSDLACIGCYHETMGPGHNYCLRRDQACASRLDAGDVAAKFELFLEGRPPSGGLLVARERHILSRRLKPTLAVSRSVDELRFRELLGAFSDKFRRIVRDRIRPSGPSR